MRVRVRMMVRVLARGVSKGKGKGVGLVRGRYGRWVGMVGVVEQRGRKKRRREGKGIREWVAR
jgi:hypothetical protein